MTSPVCHPDRKHRARGLCGACYERWNLENNPGRKARVAAYRKEWRRKHYEQDLKSIRNGQLKKDFGITLDDYNRMAKEQNYLCLICGKPENSKALAVDHDHETGKVRGLLCLMCNTKLDWFIRNREAIDTYLRVHITHPLEPVILQYGDLRIQAYP